LVSEPYTLLHAQATSLHAVLYLPRSSTPSLTSSSAPRSLLLQAFSSTSTILILLKLVDICQLPRFSSTTSTLFNNFDHSRTSSSSSIFLIHLLLPNSSSIRLLLSAYHSELSIEVIVCIRRPVSKQLNLDRYTLYCYQSRSISYWGFQRPRTSTRTPEPFLYTLTERNSVTSPVLFQPSLRTLCPASQSSEKFDF